MAQSTQGHTLTIRIILTNLGDHLRYEIDPVTLAEGKIPESDETAAQLHFDCLQCRSRYFISPTIVEMATQVAEIKKEPQLDLFDIGILDKIKEEDFDDEDIVEIDLISSTLDNAEIDQNVNELAIKTKPLKERSISPKKEFTCSECLNKFCTEYNLFKHTRLEHQKELRNCLMCSWSRMCTIKEFRSHLRSEHPALLINKEGDNFSNDGFPCSECSKKLRTKCRLIKHKRLRHHRELRNCMVCSWSRKCTRIQFKYHLRRQHPSLQSKEFRLDVQNFNGVDYPCIYCEDQKVFTSFDELKDHLRSSHKRYYVCETCPNAYTAPAQLKKHFKLVHEKETFSSHSNESRAEFIEISAKNKEILKVVSGNRIQIDHLNMKPFIPLVRIDSVVKIIDLHKKKNGVNTNLKPFICDICSASFKTKSSIKGHMNVHLGKRLPCSECPKLFTSERHLRNHKKVLHQGQPVNPLFTCDICQVSFKKKCNLTYHITSRHLGKRYPCSECPKSFHFQRILVQHKKNYHQWTKLHSCEVCDWTQTCTRAELHSHFETYHEKQRYKCDKCTKSFSLAGTLNTHLKQVHNVC